MQRIIDSIMRRTDAFLGRRPSSSPYISGDSFRALADHVYGDLDAGLDPAAIRKGDLVFVKADKIEDFMRGIHPHIAEPYRIITHNADAQIDARHIPFIEDGKVIHWFAQNAAISHPKLMPVPIGLENRHWHVNGKISLFDKLRSDMARRPGADASAKKDRILFAFNISTNEKERRPAFEIFSAHPLADGIGAIAAQGRPSPDGYARALSGYKFVASPPGNGLDCHRTWEAMYLGVVPIVKRSAAMEYFRSLGAPLWIVDSWDEVPRDAASLIARYEEIKPGFAAECLWMDYWTAAFERK